VSAAALAALLALGAPGEPAAPPVVSGVVLKLPPGQDAAVLEGLVAVRSGQPLQARALRRTATLLYQLALFSDVVLRAVPDGRGQVTLVVECRPKRIVRQVNVEVRAAKPLLARGELTRLVGMATGDEFWPNRLEEVEERLRAAYLRRGHRAARVLGRATGETLVDVTIEVEEGPPTLVSAVDVGEAERIAGGSFAAALQTRPGAALDLDRLDEDVKTLRLELRRAGWLRSTVGQPVLASDGDRVRVDIPVEAGPLVDFRFAGNEAVPERELQAQLKIEWEQPLDAAALETYADRVRAWYLQRGFAAARVEVRERSAGPGRSAVLFLVDEGRRYQLLPARFSGNAARSESWLRARLEEGFEAQREEDASARDESERLALAAGSTAPMRALPAGDPGRAWYEPDWERAVARIIDFYRADGYLDARHAWTRAVFDARAGTIEVEVRLEEGVRTMVDWVAFEGNAFASEGALRQESKVRPAERLSLAEVEATRVAVTALYARGGYLYARVQDLQEYTPDRRGVGIRFRIEEGPRVQIGAIQLAGNRQTREAVVRRELQVRSGDTYDPDAASRSQSALLRLGVFRSVALRLDDPEIPETEKDLTVDLDERPWQTMGVGGGFSLVNGPRLFAEYGQPNLFGRALELGVRAKVNNPAWGFARLQSTEKKLGSWREMEGFGNVGLRYPRLLQSPFPVAAHLDVIGERANRSAYDMSRASTVLGLDAALHRRMSLLLQGEVEVDDICTTRCEKGVAVTLGDVERLRFPEGITTLVSLRPTATIDFRDDPSHPRSGWVASLTADWAHSIAYRGGEKSYVVLGLLPRSQVFTHMLKLQGTATGYLLVGRSMVLALSLRAGRVFPLDRDSKTIPPKRFYLGGPATMRGWNQDEMIPEDQRQALLQEVARCNSGEACSDAALAIASGRPASAGGEAFVLAKVEARFPFLFRGLEAGVFVDTGDLWLNPRDMSLSNPRIDVGFGLRLLTPVGPAVADVGFNPARDARLREPVAAFHFSIGFF